MVPLDRALVSSYRLSIATMSLRFSREEASILEHGVVESGLLSMPSVAVSSEPSKIGRKLSSKLKTDMFSKDASSCRCAFMRISLGFFRKEDPVRNRETDGQTR